MVTQSPVQLTSRRHGLAEQARALAVVLDEEFGIPFVFCDAATGAVVHDGAGCNDALGRPLDPAVLAEVLADGRATATPCGPKGYQLVLPLRDASGPVLLAVGFMEALAPSERERSRLQKWLQAVADRLRLAEQLAGKRRGDQDQSNQATVAWEALLTLDHLIRRVRIHRDSSKNRQRILDDALGMLNAEAIAWVPRQAGTPVHWRGETCIAPSDCRPLIELLLLDDHQIEPADPYVCNDFAERPMSARFPRVRHVMIFSLKDQAAPGWVVAINKRERDGASSPPARPGFRRSDAALFTPFVALLELHARSNERYQGLRELLVGLTRSLTAALDAKDSYTYGHSERVARIAIELGRELGMHTDELSDIYLAGLLHDVGKIGVRDAVLTKTEPLTKEEFDHIKQHVTIGYAILSDLRPIRNLLPGVLYHHERIDGTGYPDGLAGEAIPLLARILAVADAYDAMSTTRPYRDAMPCRKVEEILQQGAGKQWDARIIEAFGRCKHKIHTIRQRGVGESLQQALDGALRMGRSSFEELVHGGRHAVTAIHAIAPVPSAAPRPQEAE